MNAANTRLADGSAPTARFVAAVVLAAALATAARAAVPTAPEAIARQTLLDALAPTLAARGAAATVTVAPPDARRTPAPCAAPNGFLPPGARLVGRTLVGLRCPDGTWQTFLTAEIRVEASTWQATRSLRAGDTIGAGDVVQATAALTQPDLDAAGDGTRSRPAMRGLATLDGRAAAPYGRVVLRPVAAGRALTASDVRDEGRINAGDPVRVVYRGDGFAVTTEGHSIGPADPGTNVSIRLASGATVNGTLRADRLVELPR